MEKEVCVRNSSSFNNKALPKEIMVRTKFKNALLKNRSEELRTAAIRNEIIVFHFCKKVRYIPTITYMRKTFVIIANFGK